VKSASGSAARDGLAAEAGARSRWRAACRSRPGAREDELPLGVGQRDQAAAADALAEDGHDGAGHRRPRVLSTHPTTPRRPEGPGKTRAHDREREDGPPTRRQELNVQSSRRMYARWQF